ncbi:MAG: pyridoxamine 5'-phosphate oxidase [Acidimicrobiales bacterium]
MEISEVTDDPLRQLAAWLDEARAAGAPLPESMCVATASPAAVPSARMVLLRGLDEGLVFFTDYGSDKAADLEANPRAAAVLHWMFPTHRQVRVIGPVGRVTPAESDAYWSSRPVGSRRSALASSQSRVVASRDVLESAVAALAGLAEDDPALARPERWGGYRIVPDAVELWEERPSRLHDRVRYLAVSGGGWQIERLSP